MEKGGRLRSAPAFRYQAFRDRLRLALAHKGGAPIRVHMVIRGVELEEVRSAVRTMRVEPGCLQVGLLTHDHDDRLDILTRGNKDPGGRVQLRRDDVLDHTSKPVAF